MAIGRRESPVQTNCTSGNGLSGSPRGTIRSMPARRPLWSGSISFGLVNVPVRVFSAIHEHRLHFHLVHEADDGRIRYEKVCTLENRTVDDEEVVKAFELEPGRYVHLSEDDFEAVQAGGGHALELQEFVRYDQIDPLYFAHSYVVAPAEGAEPSYALLVRSMADTGLVGIGTFVMRNREYLGCLRVYGGQLILEQLHFADEIQLPDAVDAPALPKVGGRELELARGLIGALAADWEPGRYRDSYTDALRALVDRKVAGEDVRVERRPEPDEPVDLMEALRRSVAEARKTSAPTVEPTRKELEARARKLRIAGRSKMSKAELESAVADAERQSRAA
jgi:DNA end-binding protein Ku